LTTVRQIAANRINAKKAAGPKTKKGKARSSRNAFKHGLSLPLLHDATLLERTETISRALAGDGLSGAKFKAACVAAESYLDVENVREVHRSMMNSAFVCLSEIQQWQEDGIGQSPGADEDSHWRRFGGCLVQLERLSRYERRAASRWRKAVKAIEPEGT
jgi:hypothetical protein